MTDKIPRWKTEKSKEYQRKYCKEYGRRPEVRARRRREALARKTNDPDYFEKWKCYHKNYVLRNRLKVGARHIVCRCRASGMEYDRKYLLEIAETNPIMCPSCNELLDYSYQKQRGKPALRTPSYDRVNSSNGYIRGNVVIIYWRCNVVKRDATVDELEKIAAYMRRHYAHN